MFLEKEMLSGETQKEKLVAQPALWTEEIFKFGLDLGKYLVHLEH